MSFPLGMEAYPLVPDGKSPAPKKKMVFLGTIPCTNSRQKRHCALLHAIGSPSRTEDAFVAALLDIFF